MRLPEDVDMRLASTLGNILPFETFLQPLGLVSDVLSGARGCLFTFHRAATSDLWERLPNRNFYLDLAYLDRLLRYLSAHGWAIVTIDEAMRRAQANRAGDRFVNFSVDDCYRDTFEEIAPLFRRHGVPVTLYVTTGIPDETLPLWGAGLEHILLHSGEISLNGQRVDAGTNETKRELFQKIAGLWDGPQAGASYAAFCVENGFDAAELHERHGISWEMLEELKDDPLVEIGAHTVTHARLSALPEARALTELTGCRRRLQEKLDLEVRHFAFPYGRSGDAGPRDFRLAREAGFATAATTRKGLLRRGGDAHSLPRNTLNGGARSLAMAEMHLTGVSGLAARMLGRV
jgi:peptidoglycan/xylan/chitin deacetylase (PgdA/CDA1 family)